MRTLDATSLSFGYLLPTRDAVTLGKPAARPLLALGERGLEAAAAARELCNNLALTESTTADPDPDRS